MKSQKNGNLNTQIERYFVIYKRSPLKMQEIKKFHKSKIDGLQKLSTRAPWFYDFLHFKGWSYLNHKISFNLRVQVAIFLTFHNRFMMLVHMEVHSKYHLLMMD